MKNGKPINLEARLKRLEADVTEIKALLSARQESEEPWWKAIVGSMAGNPVAEEIRKLTAEISEKERKKARRTRSKNKA
jgi:hypothetical protein